MKKQGLYVAVISFLSCAVASAQPSPSPMAAPAFSPWGAVVAAAIIGISGAVTLFKRGK
jgi:hypothetical protein